MYTFFFVNNLPCMVEKLQYAVVDAVVGADNIEQLLDRLILEVHVGWKFEENLGKLVQERPA